MNNRIIEALKSAGFMQVHHDPSIMETDGVWENGVVPEWVKVVAGEYHCSFTNSGVFIAGWKFVADSAIEQLKKGER